MFSSVSAVDSVYSVQVMGMLLEARRVLRGAFVFSYEANVLTQDPPGTVVKVGSLMRVDVAARFAELKACML